MFKCIKCSKVFEFKSDYNRHKDRKTECNAKNKYDCNICNKNFKYESKLEEHIKTKKHRNNINKDQFINKEIDNTIIQLEEIKILNGKIIELETKINRLKIENKDKIKQLETKINILEIENKCLKQNNKIHNDNEYIYIIHPAQCININIYKIGRTKNIINRFKDYPKGSELLFSISCKNSSLIESKILNYLRNNDNYINSKEHGSEYFQCNLNNLKNDISKIINE
jgi:hypothetical protein